MMKPIDQSSIRKQNVRMILDLLSNTSEMTRNVLAEKTGLSLMTVSNLVELLKGYDVLSFTPLPRTEHRSSGRKAELISLSGEKHAWLVLELNNRNFHFTLMGFDQMVLGRGSMSVCGCEDSMVEKLELFAREVRSRIEGSLGTRNLLGVAIITPDAYEKTDDTLIGRRAHLGFTAIKDLFRRHLGDYDYIVDKDVKYAVRAFSILMEHSDCHLLYFLCIGEELGGAVVHNHSLLYGLNHASGDAGHFRDASGLSFDEQLSLGAFAHALGLNNASPEALSAFAQSEPERYLSQLRRFAEKTAELLSSVVRFIDPEHVVIECRYAHPFPEEYLAMLSESMTARMHTDDTRLPETSLVPARANIMLAGAVHALQLEWIEQIIS